MIDNNFKMTLKNGEEIYFNIGKKIVGRTPTKTNLNKNSNVKKNSSDNSLYIAPQMHFDDLLKMVFGYITSSDINKGSKILMNYMDKSYSVNLHINKSNSQTQISLSEQTKQTKQGKYFTGTPLNAIAKQKFGELSAKDLYKKIRNYIVFFDFNNNLIEIKDKKEFSNSKHLEYFNEIITLLNDNDIKILKTYTHSKKIQKNKLNREISLKSKDLDTEDFLKINYYVRNSKKQKQFRKSLIDESKKLNDGNCVCAICEKKISEQFLIASHIIPVSVLKEKNINTPGKDIFDCNNGLLLCPNHDKLFDKMSISFDEDNKIILGDISEEELYTFGLTKDFKLNDIYMTKKRKENLRYHRNTLNLLHRIKLGDE